MDIPLSFFSAVYAAHRYNITKHKNCTKATFCRIHFIQNTARKGNFVYKLAVLTDSKTTTKTLKGTMKKRSPRTNRGQQSRLNLWKMLLKIKLKYKLDWLTSTQKASTFERMRTLQTETWILRKSYPSETVPRNGRDPSCLLTMYKALLGMSMNYLEELLHWFCLGQCSRCVVVISSMDHKFWVWKK